MDDWGNRGCAAPLLFVGIIMCHGGFLAALVVWTESLVCISDGFPNRRLIESLRDRHQGAGHAYGNDGARLADHT
jgi:hypothetical protein